MRFFRREEKLNQFEQVLGRIIAARDGFFPGEVTPDTCMQSPTVHAIVTVLSRRMASTAIHVYRKGMKDGKETKTKLPDHPVARLLKRPNAWQTAPDFWGDATSTFIRWGRFYAWKARSSLGNVFELVPLHPGSVHPKLEDNQRFSFDVNEKSGRTEYSADRIMHVRGNARDFVEGDSPIKDVQGAIMMEILAEKFGEAFLKNGALPMMVFKYAQGVKAFKTEEEEKKFIEDFQKAFTGAKRFRALLLPKGIEKDPPVDVDNDKAQFLESREYQRTVIAGALGFPVHLTGDLKQAHYNNIEQQDQDLIVNGILPIATKFEAAMERDLLTDEDRDSGVVIRFNLDSRLRATFKERQEGLKIQREMGVTSANDWREIEGMNPRDGGDEYWNQGPSGQGAASAKT